MRRQSGAATALWISINEYIRELSKAPSPLRSAGALQRSISKMTNTDSRCPRCGAGRLQSWSELGDEEREIVQRLPGSVDYTLEERKATHRWCMRCWYEEVSGSATLA